MTADEFTQSPTCSSNTSALSSACVMAPSRSGSVGAAKEQPARESANTVGSPRYSVVQAASLRVLGRLLRPALRRGRRIR
ncbi:hypothetical protein PFZ49_03010 [Microbacterium lacticum]|uniref:hypothetical protein n=1 Tax=Microbacterium lacticum TaxID=33885 RepID=UPI003A8A86ED